MLTREGVGLTFEGRLETATGVAALVHIRVDERTMSMRSGRRPMGSWSLDEVRVERISLFRFRLTIGDEELVLVPKDPTGFASAAGAVVDLRAGRHGLRDRIKEVAGQPSAR